MTTGKKPIFTPNTPSLLPTTTKAEIVENSSEPSVKEEKNYLPTINVNDLPSKFKPYPKGVEISYTPYTFGELKKFSQSKLSVKQRYEFILEGVTVSGMPKEKLTFSDFLFLALLRKLSSVGVGEISIKYPCNKCGFENSNNIKLDTLDFNDIEAPELPAYLTINGNDMEFSPLTVEDFFMLFKEGKDKDSVAITAVQCRSHQFRAAYDIIYKANPEDSDLLNELDKMFAHSLKSLKFKCQNKEAPVTEVLDGVEIEKLVHCDYENIVELEDPGLIIQPFRGDGGTAKNRIQFGSKLKAESSGH